MNKPLKLILKIIIWFVLLSWVFSLLDCHLMNGYCKSTIVASMERVGIKTHKIEEKKESIHEMINNTKESTGSLIGRVTESPLYKVLFKGDYQIEDENDAAALAVILLKIRPTELLDIIEEHKKRHKSD